MSSWQAQAQAPAPGPGRVPRPQIVTAAGMILIVMGALQALAGIVLMFISPDDLASIGSFGNLNLDRVARGLGLLSLVIGLVEVLAGFLVLRLSPAGRMLGLALSLLGVLGGIGSISGGTSFGVVTLGLYVFVVYALFAHGAAFRRARQG